MPTRSDLRRELGQLYKGRTTPALVDVPELAFLMVDGQGDPSSSPAYASAVQALYAVSYAAKFAVKQGPTGEDFAVMPLEGLWWAADPSAFVSGDRDSWQWTAMIAQPGAVTPEVLAAAREKAAAKCDQATLAALRLERFAEGRAAQVLHVGPYSAEGPTIERLHAFIADQGLALAGKHHEIYLGDPRRTAPERLKTLLRQPVAPLA